MKGRSRAAGSALHAPVAPPQRPSRRSANAPDLHHLCRLAGDDLPYPSGPGFERFALLPDWQRDRPRPELAPSTFLQQLAAAPDRARLDATLQGPALSGFGPVIRGCLGGNVNDPAG